MLPLLSFLAISFLGPYSASANFSADLYGTQDTRPDTWGFCEAKTWDLTFKPPTGYRVRVLKLEGDLVAWPKITQASDTPVRPGMLAGVLLGFQTTAPDASVRCDLCADNTMLYMQGSTGTEPFRGAFSREVVNGLLESDNVLVIKVASWLNVTGKPIHLEPTFNVTYRFEKQ